MFRSRFAIPFLYLFLSGLFFLLEFIHPEIKLDLSLKPRDPGHLAGIWTAVFIHSNLEHLSANFIPLALCLYGIFYFYGKIALRVTLLAHFITGCLIWILARPAYHIGASGLVYALVFFTLISGAIRRNKKLMIFALIVLLFQSGLVWGMLPTDNSVSWESHLFGGITGTFLAIRYRRKGPPDDGSEHWENESETDDSKDEYREILKNSPGNPS